MSDPDFESGRSGGLTPPRGDWGKHFAGRMSADQSGSGGCALILIYVAVFAALFWSLPVVLVGFSSAIAVAPLAARSPSPPSLLRLVVTFSLIAAVVTAVLGLSLGLVVEMIERAKDPLLQGQDSVVIGHELSANHWLARTAVLGPTLFAAVILLWWLRPVSRPATSHIQVRAFLRSLITFVIVGAAMVVIAKIVLIDLGLGLNGRLFEARPDFL